MALDVINDIKAAENKAQEIRLAAAAAARDDIKLAIEDNAQTREAEIESMRQNAAITIEAAGEEAKIELGRLSAQRCAECEGLKAKAEKNLSRAAGICIERIVE
jgi:hypothetical protein